MCVRACVIGVCNRSVIGVCVCVIGQGGCVCVYVRACVRVCVHLCVIGVRVCDRAGWQGRVHAWIGAASSIRLSSFSSEELNVDCAGTAGPPAAAAAARSW